MSVTFIFPSYKLKINREISDVLLKELPEFCTDKGAKTVPFKTDRNKRAIKTIISILERNLLSKRHILYLLEKSDFITADNLVRELDFFGLLPKSDISDWMLLHPNLYSVIGEYYYDLGCKIISLDENLSFIGTTNAGRYKFFNVEKEEIEYRDIPKLSDCLELIMIKEEELWRKFARSTVRIYMDSDYEIMVYFDDIAYYFDFESRKLIIVNIDDYQDEKQEETSDNEEIENNGKNKIDKTDFYVEFQSKIKEFLDNGGEYRYETNNFQLAYVKKQLLIYKTEGEGISLDSDIKFSFSCSKSRNFGFGSIKIVERDEKYLIFITEIEQNKTYENITIIRVKMV